MATQTDPVIAYVALGANLGDRAGNIASAVEALRQTPGISVTKRSKLIENPAVGGPQGSPAFLNGVAEIETTLTPEALLARFLEIERSLGRQRRAKWEPRAIDLDLILYGDQIVDTPDLKVPHPLMHERRFVLEPLVEIAPRVMHPVLEIRADALLKQVVTVAPDERGGLVREIEHVFSGIERGDGVTLHEAEEIDCHGTNTERANARKRDTEIRWQDVSWDDLEQYSSVWSFFDPKGFLYYLPAGMVWSLVRGELSESATPDNILSNLARQETQGWCERLLSPQRMRATARFVDFMLKTYWRGPEKNPELRPWLPIAQPNGPTRFEQIPPTVS